MTIKIESKITGFQVKKESSVPEENKKVPLERMDEFVKRPEFLSGGTYKIKVPINDWSVYVTINYITLNAGTEFEQLHPMELFINSKHPEHDQWIRALTRLCSAIFRKGGDYLFMIKEFKEIFDASGGYRKKKKYYPSLVANIGDVIEQDFYRVGILKKEAEDSIGESTAIGEQLGKIMAEKIPPTSFIAENKKMLLCPSCSEESALLLDGCLTCTSCLYSKCS